MHQHQTLPVMHTHETCTNIMLMLLTITQEVWSNTCLRKHTQNGSAACGTLSNSNLEKPKPKPKNTNFKSDELKNKTQSSQFRQTKVKNSATQDIVLRSSATCQTIYPLISFSINYCHSAISKLQSNWHKHHNNYSPLSDTISKEQTSSQVTHTYNNSQSRWGAQSSWA